MHKPYQTVHIFRPKSEKHEAFFLLFVCSHGFLLYSLLCLFFCGLRKLNSLLNFLKWGSYRSSILYISQNLFIKRPSVSLATS